MRRKVVKMKAKAKSIILILIVLGIIFAFSPVITTNLSFITGNSNKRAEYSDDINLDTENLKLSAVSGKIHIDNNWSATESTYSWCTGSGTFSDPYIIEDLVIDGGGSGSCIWIENSDVYFTIENCSLYNSGVNWDDSGISLINVDNGQLIANIANNSGIRFDNCKNCTISGNNVSNSNNGGIHLSYGSNNTIIGNTANYAGISISETDSNIVSGNMLNGGGIFLGNANYTRIFNNTVEHTDGDGISFHGSSNNNWISKNFVNNNTWGISFVEQSHNNTAIDNYVNDSSAIGIEVYHDNHTILDDIITNNGNGIMITSSNNNISGNTISFNDESGIHLGTDSKNNIIFSNTIEGNLVNNGYDEGTNNQWDNGTIGNYWSDYPGVDVNDDGIGDTPYTINGSASSQDNFPIWDDGPEFKIPGYNLILLLGILSVVAITLSKKLKKF